MQSSGATSTGGAQALVAPPRPPPTRSGILSRHAVNIPSNQRALLDKDAAWVGNLNRPGIDFQAVPGKVLNMLQKQARSRLASRGTAQKAAASETASLPPSARDHALPSPGTDATAASPSVSVPDATPRTASQPAAAPCSTPHATPEAAERASRLDVARTICRTSPPSNPPSVREVAAPTSTGEPSELQQQSTSLGPENPLEISATSEIEHPIGGSYHSPEWGSDEEEEEEEEAQGQAKDEPQPSQSQRSQEGRLPRQATTPTPTHPVHQSRSPDGGTSPVDDLEFQPPNALYAPPLRSSRLRSPDVLQCEGIATPAPQSSLTASRGQERETTPDRLPAGSMDDSMDAGNRLPASAAAARPERRRLMKAPVFPDLNKTRPTLSEKSLDSPTDPRSSASSDTGPSPSVSPLRVEATSVGVRKPPASPVFAPTPTPAAARGSPKQHGSSTPAAPSAGTVVEAPSAETPARQATSPSGQRPFLQSTSSAGKADNNATRPPSPARTHTWMPPFEAFTLAYPDYKGDAEDFLRACYCLQGIARTGSLASFLFDDVVRSYLDFIEYIQDETSGKPLNLLQWYFRNADALHYDKNVITKDNVASVLQAYPEKLQVIRQITHETGGTPTNSQRAAEPAETPAAAAATPAAGREPGQPATLRRAVPRRRLSDEPPPTLSQDDSLTQPNSLLNLSVLRGSCSTGESTWPHGHVSSPPPHALYGGNHEHERLSQSQSQSQDRSQLLPQYSAPADSPEQLTGDLPLPSECPAPESSPEQLTRRPRWLSSYPAPMGSLEKLTRCPQLLSGFPAPEPSPEQLVGDPPLPSECPVPAGSSQKWHYPVPESSPLQLPSSPIPAGATPMSMDKIGYALQSPPPPSGVHIPSEPGGSQLPSAHPLSWTVDGEEGIAETPYNAAARSNRKRGREEPPGAASPVRYGSSRSAGPAVITLDEEGAVVRQYEEAIGVDGDVDDGGLDDDNEDSAELSFMSIQSAREPPQPAMLLAAANGERRRVTLAAADIGMVAKMASKTDDGRSAAAAKTSSESRPLPETAGEPPRKKRKRTGKKGNGGKPPVSLERFAEFLRKKAEELGPGRKPWMV